MLTVKYTKKFTKDLKLMKKRGLNIELLHSVVKIIANNEKLPEQYRDHFLTGNYTRL